MPELFRTNSANFGKSCPYFFTYFWPNFTRPPHLFSGVLCADGWIRVCVTKSHFLWHQCCRCVERAPNPHRRHFFLAKSRALSPTTVTLFSSLPLTTPWHLSLVLFLALSFYTARPPWASNSAPSTASARLLRSSFAHSWAPIKASSPRVTVEMWTLQAPWFSNLVSRLAWLGSFGFRGQVASQQGDVYSRVSRIHSLEQEAELTFCAAFSDMFCSYRCNYNDRDNDLSHT